MFWQWLFLASLKLKSTSNTSESKMKRNKVRRKLFWKDIGISTVKSLYNLLFVDSWWQNFQQNLIKLCVNSLHLSFYNKVKMNLLFLLNIFINTCFSRKSQIIRVYTGSEVRLHGYVILEEIKENFCTEYYQNILFSNLNLLTCIKMFLLIRLMNIKRQKDN